MEERDVGGFAAQMTTVTKAVPAVATSAAKMSAVTWLPPINVVVRGLPFQFTIESIVKPVPFTVSVNAPAARRGARGDQRLVDERDRSLGQRLSGEAYGAQ